MRERIIINCVIKSGIRKNLLSSQEGEGRSHYEYIHTVRSNHIIQVVIHS